MSVGILVHEKGVDFLLSLGNNFFDLFCAILRVIPEGGTNGASDHGFKFLLFLNFIAIISN